MSTQPPPTPIRSFQDLIGRIPWRKLGGLTDPVSLMSGCSWNIEIPISSPGWILGWTIGASPYLVAKQVLYGKSPTTICEPTPLALWTPEQPIEALRVVLLSCLSAALHNPSGLPQVLHQWDLFGLSEEDLREAMMDPYVETFLRGRYPRLPIQATDYGPRGLSRLGEVLASAKVREGKLREWLTEQHPELTANVETGSDLAGVEQAIWRHGYMRALEDLRQALSNDTSATDVRGAHCYCEECNPPPPAPRK